MPSHHLSKPSWKRVSPYESTTEHRRVGGAYWWEKAEASLGAAQRDSIAGDLNFAMSRVYYAAFYAVSALLLDRQFSFRKHSGVRAVFHREFIKPGFVPRKWGQFYDQIFEDRQEGDYVAFIEFEADYVTDRLQECTDFLAVIKPLIPSL